MADPTLLARVRASVLRIMLDDRRKSPLGGTYGRLAGDLLARSVVKNEAATISNGRLVVSADERKQVWRDAKRLAWMLNRDTHFGQQATACVEKVKRGLQNGSLSREQFHALLDEFGKLRVKHIKKNAKEMPRTKAIWLKLDQPNLVARRLISEEEIDRVGHAIGNCLGSNSVFAKEYKKRLRQGDVELIVLAGDRDDYKVLLSFDAHERFAEQAKGWGNSRPTEWREAIIEVLAWRRVVVGECTDLLHLGISDEIVTGRSRGATQRFVISQRDCEVGDGFLAIAWADQTILLRSVSLLSGVSEACVIGSDNEEMSDVAQATAAARVWIRRACATHPEFAQACSAAFQSVPRVHHLDWFNGCPIGRPNKPPGAAW